MQHRRRARPERRAEDGPGPTVAAARVPEVANLLDLQHGAGNRAVARLLDGRRPAGPVLARTITISPAQYAGGHGVATANLTDTQLAEYFRLAVKDDLEWARRQAAKINDQGTLNAWQRYVTLITNTTLPMPDRVSALEGLIRAVNDYPETVKRRTGPRKVDTPIERPENRDTRYATEPADDDYQHDDGGAQGTTWGDDPTMWQKFGQDFGAIEPGLQSTKARKAEKPVSQLPWADATRILPRPLINLLFDVRLQLESGGNGGVVDERTAGQQERRDKSPHEPGSLRSWHQDEHGTLPKNQFDAQQVPQHGRNLHEHYTQTSQSGAGSSVDKNPATSPTGFAEYTGTGTNTEHNTKVVLDYVRKRVYLTLTHYEYWALIGGGGQPELWNSGTQDPAQAEGKLEKHLRETQRRPDQGKLMSPWVEVLLT